LSNLKIVELALIHTHLALHHDKVGFYGDKKVIIRLFGLGLDAILSR